MKEGLENEHVIHGGGRSGPKPQRCGTGYQLTVKSHSGAISQCLQGGQEESCWLQLDGPPRAHAQTINLPTNQEGYEESKTTTKKLLQRRIHWGVVYFHCIIFWDVRCENM